MTVKQKSVVDKSHNPLFTNINYPLENETLSSLKDKGYLSGYENVFEITYNLNKYIRNKKALNQKKWNEIADILLNSKRDRYSFNSIIKTIDESIKNIKNKIDNTDYSVKIGNEKINVERLSNYIDPALMLSFIVYEVTPKGYWPEARVEVLRMMLEEGYDPAKVPAYWDRKYISFGAYQMRMAMHNSLRKIYGNIPEYEKCLTVSCQTKAAYLLLYDGLNNFQVRVFNKSPQLIYLFGNAPDDEKRKFITILSSAMFNTGVNDVVNIMRTVLGVKYKKLSSITHSFLTHLKNEGGTISSPYAREMPRIYNYVNNKMNTKRIVKHKKQKMKIVKKKKKDNEITKMDIDEIRKMLKVRPVRLDLKLGYLPADSDGLYVDISNISENEIKTGSKTKQSTKKQKPEYKKLKRQDYEFGSIEFLHAYKRKGKLSYTFTLPKDWTTDDIDFMDIGQIMSFNNKTIAPGDWFWVPTNELNLSPQYVNVKIQLPNGLSEDKLLTIAATLCNRDPVTSAKIIRLYSNIVDMKKYQNKKNITLRIPYDLLKDEFKKGLLRNKLNFEVIENEN